MAKGSIGDGGAEIHRLGRRIFGDDLGLAVLRGDVLVNAGFAADQLAESHVLEGDIALGERKGGRVNHELDRSISGSAAGADHRAFAKLAPGLEALVDAVLDLDDEIVVRTVIVVPWHDGCLVDSIIPHPSLNDPTRTADVVIVGGGAAGLATAIFAARALRKDHAPTRAPRIVLLDGARTLGAKILVSGGSRCNVTNAHVDTADFWRSGSPFVRQVLRALPVSETISFFDGIGVTLKEEPLGKLFPITNKSRTVLDALLRETNRLGVEIHTASRVNGLVREAEGWRLLCPHGDWTAKRVVLATGGLSLPKTGSDGFGYEMARQQGHAIVPTTPALEPLILGGDFHAPLSGIAHEAALRVSRTGEKPVDIRGSLLWTHFGVSGPLALNASRFMRRARIDGAAATLLLSFVPGHSAEDIDKELIVAAREQPHLHLATELVRGWGLTQAIATRLAVRACGQDEALSKLTREKRLAVVRALTAFPLEVIDGRGYNFAEVTSGGVPLSEVNPKTMESRLVQGLHFVGEILDVDGRIGGFNFQWAWSTGKVAGEAISRASADSFNLR